MPVEEISVSAVVMRDDRGRVLNVRKRGTRMLMLPGGKPEPGEGAAETAIREFREELGVRLDPTRLEALGEFRARAANEPGHEVVAAVFLHPFVDGVRVGAEIEALEWVDPDAAETALRDDLAPLNMDIVFPALREVGLR